MEDVTCQLVKYDLFHHLFANDMQAMLHCLPSNVPQTMSTFNDCFIDVNGWFALKRLQLNASKTEQLVFGTANNLKKIPPGSEVMQAAVADVLSRSALRV